MNEARRQAEKKAEDEYKIRTKLEESKKEVDEEKKIIVKDVNKLKRENRKSQLKLLTMEKLKHLVKEKSKIDNFLRDNGRNIRKDDILKIIYDEEGLNDPFVTPVKLTYL